MKSLARVIIGYRDDLPLVAKWWHRLFKVVFAVLMAVTVITVGINTSFPTPTLQNTYSYSTLFEYINRHPTDVNAVEGFQNLDGFFGGVNRNTGAITHLTDPFWSDIFCSGDMKHHAKEAVEFMKQIEPGTIDDNAAAETEKLIASDKAPYMCLFKDSSKWPPIRDIISYRWTRTTITKHLLTALSSGLAAGLMLWVVVGNIYYRGLIYVVFGSRTRPGA